jgi:hypothetical protein
MLKKAQTRFTLTLWLKLSGGHDTRGRVSRAVEGVKPFRLPGIPVAVPSFSATAHPFGTIGSLLPLLQGRDGDTREPGQRRLVQTTRPNVLLRLD